MKSEPFVKKSTLDHALQTWRKNVGERLKLVYQALDDEHRSAADYLHERHES